eukprot:5047047-Pyramimonas_sp.AAC.1
MAPSAKGRFAVSAVRTTGIAKIRQRPWEPNAHGEFGAKGQQTLGQSGSTARRKRELRRRE